MKYFVVDAFTDKPFGGNTAGVVLLDENIFPDDRLMQDIAAELRYSETAFVVREGRPEFSVRYFTPAGEVPLCGHATIAAFSVLFAEKLVADGELCLNNTRVGRLKVLAGPKVMMQMAVPQILGNLDAGIMKQVYDIVGGSHEGQKLGPQIVSTGLPDIILPVSSLAELDALNPDMPALSALSKDLDVVGVHAFALGNDGFTAHVRNFAPLYGIDEESATGTSNAALTYYLYSNGLLCPDAEYSFVQGEKMGRRSVVRTSLKVSGTNCEIWVGGSCAVVACGRLLP